MPGGVDLSPPGERVGELQVRVLKGPSERVAKPARRGRLAELNYETGDLGAGAPAAHPRQRNAEREDDQRNGLGRPQALVDTVIRKESSAKAMDVIGRYQAQI